MINESNIGHSRLRFSGAMLSLHLLCFFFLFRMPAANGQPVTIGHIDTVYSSILGEKRALWIYVPRQEPNPAMAKKTFPVVYLLDGDAHFGYVSSLTRQQSEGFNHLMPEMIIVGIPNTDRLRDLTPSRIRSTRTYTDSNMFRNTGGGRRFLDFLEKELMPYLEATYPVAPQRCLVGHSLGGLLATDAMVKRPGLFDAWLAIDPSFWYDNRRLLTDAGGAGKFAAGKKERYFLAIANSMQTAMDTGQLRMDTSVDSEDMRAILDFADTLHRRKDRQLHWTYRYYPQEDHGSVAPIAIYDGLRFLFGDYRLPPFSVLVSGELDAEKTLRAQFARISARWGYPVWPPEAFVNAVGYALLQGGKHDQALRVFAMNLEAYPSSANAFDSMGDAWLKTGNRKKAAENFEQSLQRYENPAVRKKLSALSGYFSFRVN